MRRERQITGAQSMTQRSGTEGIADTIEQFILAERLYKKADNSGAEGMLPKAIARVRGDQNRWNALGHRRNPVMQFEPVHSRHIEVRDQAGDPAELGRTQEVLRRGKRLCGKSDRLYQCLGGLANGLIIVDDRN
jgi:hypothetical protein